MSPKKKRNAMPWDLLSPNVTHVPQDIYDNRYETCKKCEFFIKTTKQCKKCMCFMNMKCAMPHAYCPENKWQVYIEGEIQ